MSLDGRTAMASGESQWISGEASRNDVQRLRAQSSAILTGIDTVLADNPSMNVRLTAQQLNIDPVLEDVLQPKRIVLDSRFRMPADVKIATLDSECTVYTTANNDKDCVDKDCVDKGRQYPFTIETIETKDGQIDLDALMKDLAKKEINLLHVEAGSVLCGALLKKELVDEIIIYMAPHIMGDNAKGLFHLPELEKMKDRISLKVKDVRSIGDDIRIIALPEYSTCHR
jgi:diaminohydroxyphosphoribosylaminopyrimidine deaminase/5-amino-6-(5-phosphoribosylamino)uracil reductase